jgi:hypothetical protein
VCDQVITQKLWLYIEKFNIGATDHIDFGNEIKKAASGDTAS